MVTEQWQSLGYSCRDFQSVWKHRPQAQLAPARGIRGAPGGGGSRSTACKMSRATVLKPEMHPEQLEGLLIWKAGSHPQSL